MDDKKKCKQSGHGKVKCNVCDKIISQCRCMDCNGATLFEVCDFCKDNKGADDKKREALREKLAELCHEQWSGWMTYLFRITQYNDDCSVTISGNLVSRWMRQIQADYKDLSENEKESDRKEADRFLKILTSPKCLNLLKPLFEVEERSSPVKFLIDKNLDDLILNDRTETKPDDRVYVSDVMGMYAKADVIKVKGEPCEE